MMKHIYILLIALFFYTNIEAQVKVNPKFGIFVSDIEKVNNNFKQDAHLGWQIGVDFRIGDDMFFLKPGLFYQAIATSFDETNGVITDIDQTINFLKIPIDAGINLTGDGGVIGLHAFGGIVPNILLNVDGEINGFDKDQLKKFNLGANLGLGLDFLIFTVDLQYEFGLINFYDSTPKIKNNMVYLNVGLLF